MPALLTIGKAVRRLRDGDAIAYPTEALCGLGCDPADETAVRRIRDLASGRALRAG